MKEEDVFIEKTFRIITDIKEWYFMECSLDNKRKPSFKLLKLVIVIYGTESTEGNIKRVLGHIT